MSDNDLIRRGDALDCFLGLDRIGDVMDYISAIPAVQVGVKPLEWVDFADRGAKSRAWNDANYMIQKWSDGRWEISASYPGYSTSLYGIDRFHPTIEDAKAAAQADYDWRIRSALTVQPSPDVAALVEAFEHLLNNYLLDEHDEPELCVDDEHWSAIHDAFAALAAMKEGK